MDVYIGKSRIIKGRLINILPAKFAIAVTIQRSNALLKLVDIGPDPQIKLTATQIKKNISKRAWLTGSFGYHAPF